MIPTKQECIALLQENKTPANVIEHTKAVALFAEQVCDRLLNSGVKVNKPLVIAAALLHDIEKVKEDHEVTGATLIASKGYEEVAKVMRTHGLRRVRDDEFYPKTIEQKIVFYADKRTKGSEHVTIDERFSDIEKRYGKLEHLKEEKTIAKRIEQELQ